MALAFGGLTFKLLPDNTIEVNFDGNKTNLNYKDVKEITSWLYMQQQEIMYGAEGNYGMDVAQPAYAGEAAAIEQAPERPRRW